MPRTTEHCMGFCNTQFLTISLCHISPIHVIDQFNVSIVNLWPQFWQSIGPCDLDGPRPHPDPPPFRHPLRAPAPRSVTPRPLRPIRPLAPGLSANPAWSASPRTQRPGRTDGAPPLRRPPPGPRAGTSLTRALRCIASRLRTGPPVDAKPAAGPQIEGRAGGWVRRDPPLPPGSLWVPIFLSVFSQTDVLPPLT